MCSNDDKSLVEAFAELDEALQELKQVFFDELEKTLIGRALSKVIKLMLFVQYFVIFSLQEVKRKWQKRHF